MLAQLRTGKCPLLKAYKHKIVPLTNNSPLCPLGKNTEHTTQHLFNCAHTYHSFGPVEGPGWYGWAAGDMGAAAGWALEDEDGWGATVLG